MSLPNQLAFPSDYNVSANGVFTAGTTVTISYAIPQPTGSGGRAYTTTVCTSTTIAPLLVTGEDGNTLQTQGWISLDGGWNNYQGAGPTSQRPSLSQKSQAGSYYLDTTVGAMLVWVGPTRGWMNQVTGAANQ